MLQLLYTLSFEKYPLVLPSRKDTYESKLLRRERRRGTKLENNEECFICTNAQISIGLCFIKGPQCVCSPLKVFFLFQRKTFCGMSLTAGSMSIFKFCMENNSELLTSNYHKIKTSYSFMLNL